MALIVFDASVAIAYLDARDALHASSVAALDELADQDLRLPASAYAETLVRPAQTGQLEAVRTELERLELRIEPIDAAIAERAATLRATRKALRLGDALVLACGQALGADTVLTADRAWQTLERVRVLEPDRARSES